MEKVQTGQYVRFTVRPTTGKVSDDSKFNNLESVRIFWKIHPASQSPKAGTPVDRTDAAPLHAWSSSGKKKIVAEILYRLPSDKVQRQRGVQVSTTITVNGKEYEKRFKDQIKDQKEDTNPASFDTARLLHDEYIETVENFGGEDGIYLVSQYAPPSAADVHALAPDVAAFVESFNEHVATLESDFADVSLSER